MAAGALDLIRREESRGRGNGKGGDPCAQKASYGDKR
jgi:hypothetical protein